MEDEQFRPMLEDIEAEVSRVWDEVKRSRPMSQGTHRQKGSAISEATSVTLPPDTPPFPEKTFRVVYADPPWSYSNYSKGTKAEGAASAHYNTMSVPQMALLPVDERTDDEGSVLFLWATMPLLEDALVLMREWGFDYKTTAFTWVKLNKNGELLKEDGTLNAFSGLGYYTNSNVELVLLGRKGKSLERESKSVKQVVVAPIGAHSAKPAEVRDRIVTLYDDEPRLEMFARVAPENWDIWGNQAPTE